MPPATNLHGKLVPLPGARYLHELYLEGTNYHPAMLEEILLPMIAAPTPRSLSRTLAMRPRRSSYQVE